MGDGVKTLGLHLPATSRGVVLLIFGSISVRSYIIVCIPTVSFFQDNIAICVQVNPLK